MENDRIRFQSVFPVSSQKISFETWLTNLVKRLVDILVAILGMLLLLPLFLVLTVLVKRDSHGPALYTGPRMGKGGRIFQIVKFRTMREEPASYTGPSITGRNDPRITSFGQWLRDTKLNELPQLWNVLIGEMSLVGPRPEVPEIVETWPEPLQREILSMRPGITSPASILYRDEEKRLNSDRVVDDYMENILPDKLRLDQLYVRHHSFFSDLDAMFWTFVILIPRLGDRQIPEGWLFGGPFTRLMRRYLNWFAVDFLVALLCIGLAGTVWRLSSPLDIGLDRAMAMAVIMAFLFGLFNTALGLKSVSWTRPAAEDVLRLFVSCALVTVTLIVLFAIYQPEYFPSVRFMYMAGLSVLFGFIAVRYRLRLITGLASRWINLRNSTFGAPERVLLVGAGEGSEFAAWLLQRREFKRIYKIVGIVDDSPSKQGLRFDGLNVLGSTADIPELVNRHDVGVIFYAIARISPDDNERILSICNRTGLHVVMLSDVLDLLHHQLAKSDTRGRDGISEPFPVGEQTKNINV